MIERVEITKEVYFCCLAHAMTTEKEEVMGLLLGESDKTVVKVRAIALLTRSDKRKDRVEISPEQLMSAAQLAEQLTKDTGIQTRVLGWYHSHPHITVHASHVDLRTQKMYQGMDPGFVGLIFSVFTKDSKGIGLTQVVAFQAVERSIEAATASALHDVHASSLEEFDIPLVIVPADPRQKMQALQKLVEMQAIIQNEERHEYLDALTQQGAEENSLTGIYCAAVYQKALCRLLEYGSLPLIEVLRSRHAQIIQQQNKNTTKASQNGPENTSIQDSAQKKQQKLT